MQNDSSGAFHGGTQPLHHHIQTTPAANSSPPQVGLVALPRALAPRRSPCSQPEQGSPREGLGGFGHHRHPGSNHWHSKASPNEHMVVVGKAQRPHVHHTRYLQAVRERKITPGCCSVTRSRVPLRTHGHVPAPCHSLGRGSLPDNRPQVHTTQHLLPARQGYARQRN